jgi:hypothetical protein
MSHYGRSRRGRLTFYHASMVAWASVAAAGCSEGRPSTYPVQGSVHFADGRPVRVGIVEFRSQLDGRIAKGQIDQQGHFQLSTFDKDDGAVAGPHQMVVIQHFDPRVWSRKEPANLATGHSHPEDTAGLVHRRFADYRTSLLTAVVKPQTSNSIDLDVGEPVPLPESRRSNR